MRRILLVIDTDTSIGDVLLPASVLTSWLGATLKVVCDHRRLGAGCDRLAEGLGIPADPVVTAVGSIASAAAGLAAEIEPTLIVTDSAGLARDIALDADLPVLVVAEGIGRRLPPGPIEVPVTGEPADLDGVALAATLGPLLGRPIALRNAVDTQADPASNAEIGAEIGADGGSTMVELAARLTEAGCELVPAADDGLAGVGGAPLAVVVPVRRSDWSVAVWAALADGHCVLLAPGSNGLVERAPALSGRLETLEPGACLDHLERHTLGRIGYVADGRPMVVPTNYRFVDGIVFLRSMDGAKAELAVDRPPVCLEIDGYDEGLRCGWSVTVQGRLEPVEDPVALRASWANDPEPWVASGRWHWLRIVPDRIDGRQVEPGVI